MLQIDIRALDIGLHEFNLECMPEEVGLEPDNFSNILVDVRLQYDGREALVTADSSAISHLVCDRTAVSFDYPVKGSYTVLFSPVDNEGDAESEVRPLAATDNEIDITNIVRDTLMLAVPVRKIAPGAENETITTSYGVSDEVNGVDPRWQALAALKQESGGSGLPKNE